MTELFRTTVGSRLYGIHKEDSDHDRRGVIITPLGELLLNPTVGKNRSLVDEEGDLTLYELNHFARLLMGGNPTMLETLYSLSLHEEGLAGRFTPLLDSGTALSSLTGYLLGARNLYEKSEDRRKAAKNLAGGVTYIWLYSTLFEEGFDFNRFRDLVIETRAENEKAMEEVYENLGIYMVLAKDTAGIRSDREYAEELLVELYSEA